MFGENIPDSSTITPSKNTLLGTCSASLLNFNYALPLWPPAHSVSLGGFKAFLTSGTFSSVVNRGSLRTVAVKPWIWKQPLLIVSSIWAVDNTPMRRGIVWDPIIFVLGSVTLQGYFRGLVRL